MNTTKTTTPSPLLPVRTASAPSAGQQTLLLPKAPVFRRAAADAIDRLIPLPFIAHFFPLWAVVCIAYDLCADSRGASPGKRLLGLRTVIVSAHPARQGQPCNMGRSVLRNILWCGARLCYLSAFLAPLGFAYDTIEVLLALFSPTGRRLGDLVAGTQVTVSEQEARS
jgi:uncharacterized RDD family membrane protein YckC